MTYTRRHVSLFECRTSHVTTSRVGPVSGESEHRTRTERLVGHEDAHCADTRIRQHTHTLGSDSIVFHQKVSPKIESEKPGAPAKRQFEVTNELLDFSVSEL